MYLVFDIGGTNFRVAVSNDGKTILQSKIVPTPQDFQTGIQVLKQAADELSLDSKIEKIAGGIAGPLDKQKSMLVSSPHIPGWVKKPLKDELEKVFDYPVTLENDADLGGLGEAVYGAGKGKSIVAFITVGTGAGGVRIVEGRVDKNTSGFEPGHQIIFPGGKPCNCGGKGHLEAYIAGSYLGEAYQKEASGIKDDNIWEKVAKILSIGINNTIVYWSPDIVVLGGSVVKSLSLDKIKTYLKEELKIFPVMPEIALAALGDDAGLYGALELLK